MNFVKENITKQGTKEKEKRSCKYKKMYKKKRETREVRGLKWFGSFLLLIGFMFYIF